MSLDKILVGFWHIESRRFTLFFHFRFSMSIKRIEDKYINRQKSDKHFEDKILFSKLSWPLYYHSSIFPKNTNLLRPSFRYTMVYRRWSNKWNKYFRPGSIEVFSSFYTTPVSLQTTLSNPCSQWTFPFFGPSEVLYPLHFTNLRDGPFDSSHTASKLLKVRETERDVNQPINPPSLTQSTNEN